jgi:N-acetylmuramoyl-L-alanine amidase
MKKRSLVSICSAVLIMLIGVIMPFEMSYAQTPLELKDKYKRATIMRSEKIKILIVPGHDDEYWGTEYGSIREADVNVAIGQYLHDFLKSDSRFDVSLTRTQMGYTDTFKNYFATERQNTIDFIRHSRETFNQKLSSGQIKAATSVPHNTANDEVIITLYGINKWVNENDIDIVLHLHINDAGGRPWGSPGPYTGISVYIPEAQFSHAPVSAVIGEALYEELKLKNKVSNYPPEQAGLLEDQDLIAIGANNSVKKAATALIEYGYIYEPQFQNLNIQETVTKDFAHQTFLGIHRFFGDREVYAKNSVAPAPSVTSGSRLPYTWNKDVEKREESAHVSALQEALTKEKVYSCEVTGYYGPCTERGVKAFQKKYGISQTGVVGPLTRGKLNQLFSR